MLNGKELKKIYVFISKLINKANSIKDRKSQTNILQFSLRNAPFNEATNIESGKPSLDCA